MPNPSQIYSPGRGWPPPSRPWIMSQSWHDLLFMHWPVPASSLRVRIPPGLTLDTFDRKAWIGVVPFIMRRTRPFRLPLPFGLGDLPELNVRTYVKAGDKPGVWFFSLDAGHPLAVFVARRWYHLPYFNAQMLVQEQGDALHFRSTRTHRGAPRAEFAAAYHPTGPPYQARPGSLEHWLTERYCLYAADRRGRLYRGENHHGPWPLQPAVAEVTANSMCQPLGIDLPGTPPLLHFARRLEVVFWSLDRITP